MTGKGLYLRGVIVVLSVGWSAPHGHAATQVSPPASVRQVTLEVGADPRQKLLGFGCSLVDLPRARIPDRESGEMFDRVFRDLKMRVLRLWVGSGDPTTVGKMMDDFCRRYVDSGVIAAAQQRGVTTLLLAPDRGTGKATEPMADYARRLAGFIATLKRERGIRIDVTGVANEPDGLTPEEVAEVVRLLRAELDARSLQSVAIIAPESASADAAALRAIAGIKRDPAAWRALRGIATHSYDMAATPDFPATIAGTDKQYWMTEASDNGNEGTDDAKRAATIAARFLNDLNNGVTHWIYFIGFDASDDVAEDSDNATKLMVYDHKRSRIFTTLKYDWFRQLRAAFPDGSLIYPLTARPGGALVYTYGQKPMLNAAAARLPDGSWSLGIVNLSGVEATPEETRLYETRFHPASELHLTIGVEPLAAAGPLSFRVFRSSATRRFVSAGTVVMRQGELELVLPPRELVTLRSVLTVP